jgi:tRNA nucleotidyltransferase (CCA-adding enzyme)
MKPNVVARQGSSVKSTNKMFDDAVDPEGLIAIALADDRGRIATETKSPTEAFLRERLTVYKEMMARPFVGGKDLIDAGLAPGVHFSEALAYAHKLRLAGVPKADAMRQTLAFANKLLKK